MCSIGMGDFRERFGCPLKLLACLLERVELQPLRWSCWREVCGGVSDAASNACALCNCGIKMTKGEEGLLITNSNVSYCVRRDPKDNFLSVFFLWNLSVEHVHYKYKRRLLFRT